MTHRGWFFSFNKGSSTNVTIDLNQLPNTTWVVLAFPYPAETTFNITRLGRSGTPSALQRVDTLAQVTKKLHIS